MALEKRHWPRDVILLPVAYGVFKDGKQIGEYRDLAEAEAAAATEGRGPEIVAAPPEPEAVTVPQEPES